MTNKLPAILFLILFSFTVSTASETVNIYKKLSVLQCDSLIKANQTNPNFVILDVRTPSQWSYDHLNGSINRNYYDSDFNAQLDALPKHKTFLIHCQSGGRSSGTFSKMQSLGFAEVYDMSGGISSWESASLPTTNQFQPKLMLVSYQEIDGGFDSDTIKVTVTNRANDILTFNSLELFDIHKIYSDFNSEFELKGAEDYTFSVFHVPGYSGKDSTVIQMESNGGNLEINILLENGIIQQIPEKTFADLQIFPNPARSYLEIRSSKTSNFDEVSVININGQTVLKKTGFSTNQRLYLDNLQNGLYFLKLQKGKEFQLKKIMINR